jgi:hypothetical protein
LAGKLDDGVPVAVRTATIAVYDPRKQGHDRGLVSFVEPAGLNDCGLLGRRQCRSNQAFTGITIPTLISHFPACQATADRPDDDIGVARALTIRPPIRTSRAPDHARVEMLPIWSRRHWQDQYFHHGRSDGDLTPAKTAV